MEVSKPKDYNKAVMKYYRVNPNESLPSIKFKNGKKHKTEFLKWILKNLSK